MVIKFRKNINSRPDWWDEVPVAAPLAFNGQTLLAHPGPIGMPFFPSVGGRQFKPDNIDG